MPPPVLPNDVLIDVFALLGSRSLLYFACASKRIRNLIVPSFLFNRIAIHTGRKGSLRLFCRRIIDGDTSYGDSVRDLSVHMLHYIDKIMLANALVKMRNLHEIHLLNTSGFNAGLVMGSIGSLVYLHHLDTQGYIQYRFTPAMANLTALRSITLVGRGLYHVILSPSAEGSAMPDCRSASEKLCLRPMSWDPLGELRFTSGWPVGVWPSVHTLNLCDTFVRGMGDLNLLISFPSARSFASPQSSSMIWAQLPCNTPFISRLESFEGTQEELVLAFSAFSNLRPFVSTTDLPLYFKLDRLPSGLQALELEFNIGGCHQPLSQLITTTPNLAFLLLTLDALDEADVLATVEELVACLSHLPLAYLVCKCRKITSDREALERHALWDAVFMTPALESMPALQALHLQLESHERRWCRGTGQEDPLYSRFLELSTREEEADIC